MLADRAAWRWLSAPFAIGLALALSGTSLAANWSQPRVIASSDAWGWIRGGSVVALDDSTAVALYVVDNGEDVARVFTRRTADSGATWQAPAMLTDRGWSAAIAGDGAAVDVVWIWDGRVMYARSQDQGMTYQAPRRLSATRAGMRRAAVGRAGPLVVVAWQQGEVIRARVSADGGDTFGRTQRVASPATDPVVAVGDGIAYVASFAPDTQQLQVNRTFDTGLSWPIAATWTVPLGDDQGVSRYSITASGDRAYIAYLDEGSATIRYRAAVDNGTRWSRARRMISAAWRGWDPHIALHEGVLRAVLRLCAADSWTCAIYYSQSPDGRAWTTPQRISPRELEAHPVAVSHGTRTIAMYGGYGPPDYVDSVFIRLGPR